MPSINELKVGTELSENEAEDLSKAIHRCLRRARYDIRQRNTIKESRQFVKSAAQNLDEFLRTLIPDLKESDFETCWNKIQEHNNEAQQAAKPFLSYFYSHGLLPDSVTENALLAYVMTQGKDYELINYS